MNTNTNIDTNSRKPTLSERYNETNRYNSLMLVFVVFINVVGVIFDEVGIFSFDDKSVMRISVAINAVLALMPFLISRFTKWGGHRWFAYFLITCAVGISINSLVCLGLNAVFLVIFPTLVAITYYNRKLAVFGILASCVTAISSSFLQGKLSTIVLAFGYDMIYECMPEILNDTKWVDSKYLNNDIDVMEALFFNYALPNCLILFMLYILVRRIIKIRMLRKEENDKKLYSLKNQVLTSMSDIVENRDVSTGGHVKRTTDVVEILMDNLDFAINDKCSRYKEYVIKAAATHDLGKIAIDDDILKKPGRLTPEEFEQIKIHPVKSEELINQVLGPIEDSEFMQIARNLAKYHHERYDGKGYPEGLSGDSIPLEARIMAIADVYDALVSKRCYKAAISHDEACKIIKESMGSQFDPKLLKTFEKSMDKLEAYYAL